VQPSQFEPSVGIVVFLCVCVVLVVRASEFEPSWEMSDFVCVCVRTTRPTHTKVPDDDEKHIPKKRRSSLQKGCTDV